MAKTSPWPTLDTAMIHLRDADLDLSAGILRTERAARTPYDAETLILLRRARRALNRARTLCAAIHPNGIPNWQPPTGCPDEEE